MNDGSLRSQRPRKSALSTTSSVKSQKHRVSFSDQPQLLTDSFNAVQDNRRITGCRQAWAHSGEPHTNGVPAASPMYLQLQQSQSAAQVSDDDDEQPAQVPRSFSDPWRNDDQAARNFRAMKEKAVYGSTVEASQAGASMSAPRLKGHSARDAWNTMQSNVLNGCQQSFAPPQVNRIRSGCHSAAQNARPNQSKMPAEPPLNLPPGHDWGQVLSALAAIGAANPHLDLAALFPDQHQALGGHSSNRQSGPDSGKPSRSRNMAQQNVAQASPSSSAERGHSDMQGLARVLMCFMDGNRSSTGSAGNGTMACNHPPVPPDSDSDEDHRVARARHAANAAKAAAATGAHHFSGSIPSSYIAMPINATGSQPHSQPRSQPVQSASAQTLPSGSKVPSPDLAQILAKQAAVMHQGAKVEFRKQSTRERLADGQRRIAETLGQQEMINKLAQTQASTPKQAPQGSRSSQIKNRPVGAISAGMMSESTDVPMTEEGEEDEDSDEQPKAVRASSEPISSVATWKEDFQQRKQELRSSKKAQKKVMVDAGAGATPDSTTCGRAGSPKDLQTESANSSKATGHDETPTPVADTKAGEDGPLSIGSLLHDSGECRPCAHKWKAGGCAKGKDCNFCHACDGYAFKRTKKDKVMRLRDEGVPRHRSRNEKKRNGPQQLLAQQAGLGITVDEWPAAFAMMPNIGGMPFMSMSTSFNGNFPA